MESVLVLILSILSTVLALVALWIAKSDGREHRDDRRRTNDALSEISKSVVIIENTVVEHQQQLIDTLTSLLSEKVSHTKPEVSNEYLVTLSSDPDRIDKLIRYLQARKELLASIDDEG